MRAPFFILSIFIWFPQIKYNKTTRALRGLVREMSSNAVLEGLSIVNT